MNRIPVVFICDENYAMPTAVAISSIKYHKNRESTYEIFIIAQGLSKESTEKLLSINDVNFTVNVLERSLSEKQMQVVQRRERVTHAAIFKFDIPYIFSNYGKMIYLDSDTIIQHDLNEFYTIDIESYYAAVVKDTITIRGKNKHLKWLHFEEEAYFNSGVMLLNLEKMREDQIPEKLLDYRINGINHFMDQDALNVVFSDKVKYVSVKYNMLNCFFEWHSIDELMRFYQEPLAKCLNKNYDQAVIIHFGDKKKPWQYNMGYLSTKWRKYYKMSPYASLSLELQPLSIADKNRNSPIYKASQKIKRAIKYCKKHGIFMTLKNFLKSC